MSLGEEVVRKLLEKKYTIALSESCTGGLLTAALVDVPGVSEVLLEGVVTYSNLSKMKRLGVSGETLEKFGAVSAETAIQMAEGVAKFLGADIGVSTTGIAGPGGGSEEKPVGLVYVGVCFGGNKNVYAEELRLTGNRREIRERTVLCVLEKVLNILSNLQEE